MHIAAQSGFVRGVQHILKKRSEAVHDTDKEVIISNLVIIAVISSFNIRGALRCIMLLLQTKLTFVTSFLTKEQKQLRKITMDSLHWSMGSERAMSM